MTNNNHPITPPPELVLQWLEGSPKHGELGISQYITTEAARWGADQELKVCCNWVDANFGQEFAQNLRLLRRPKPPSLKEQALKTIVEMANCMKAGFIPKRSDLDAIRRALESMPD